MNNDTFTQLTNSVISPVTELTAATTESPAQADHVVNTLRNLLDKRPHEVLPFFCAEDQPALLLSQCRQIAKDWPASEGVIILVDHTPLEANSAVNFWKTMNLQRENWASIDAHIIFLLQPRHYQLLLTVADHLASWIPLKLDLRETNTIARDAISTLPFLNRQDTSQTPREAAKTLKHLEYQLRQFLLENASPPHDTLIRVYYLPMLEAALNAGIIKRAETLFAQIHEEDIPSADLPRWWRVASETLIHLNQLNQAQDYTNKWFTWAKKEKANKDIAQAAFSLGKIYSQQFALDTSEKWYHLALRISEDNKYEEQIAYICLGLGEIAHLRNHLEEAKQLYTKSIMIFDRMSLKSGKALACLNISNLCTSSNNFELAQFWIDNALTISKQIEDASLSTLSYIELGRIEYKKDKFDRALHLCKTALNTCVQLGNNRLIASIYRQLGEIFQKQCNMKDALKYYKDSFELFEHQQDYHSSALLCIDLSNAFRIQHDYEESQRWALFAIEKAKRAPSYEVCLYAYDILTSIYEEEGNIKKAIDLLSRELEIYVKLNNQKCIDTISTKLQVLSEKIDKKDSTKQNH